MSADSNYLGSQRSVVTSQISNNDYTESHEDYLGSHQVVPVTTFVGDYLSSHVTTQVVTDCTWVTTPNL